jgi:hypothetical protein
MSYFTDILRIGFHQVCISGGTISRMLEAQGALVVVPPAEKKKPVLRAVD